MLQSVVQPLVRRVTDKGSKTLIQRAIASLRARGTDAHLWLPGVGTINGLTTGNYLESTGNTLATVDNPTGLVLDALGTVGVELVDTANTAAAWVKYSNNTVEQDDVAVKITYVDFGNGAFCNLTAAGGLTSDLVANKTYHITALAKVNAGNSVALSLAGGATGSQTITSTEFSPVSIIFTPTGSSYIAATSMAAGEVIWVKNISVREVSGIHAQQGTTANKPLLRRGLVNLALQSGDFTNASWVKSSATVSGGAIVEDGTLNSHRIQQTITTTASSVHTAIVKVKKNTRTWIALYISGANVGRYFNLDAGTAGQTLVGAPITSEITSAGDGWFYCAITYNATASSVVQVYLASADGVNNYTGDSASSVYINTAALFQGTLTASEILAAGGIPVTTTAAASNPDAGRYSWAFDGSNDSLALGSVPFQMGDDHCVIAASSCSSNPPSNSVVADVAGKDTGQRCAAIYYNSTRRLVAAWTDDTIVTKTITHATSLGDAVNVATAVKVGNDKRLRINSVQSGSAETSVMGTTTLNTGKIGSATWSNSFHVGTTGPVLAIKGTVTDAELLMYERLIAALTPGAPTF